MKNKLYNFREITARNIYNIPGWRTRRRIVVLESDDWGSIRMPDKATYDKLLSKGIRVDKSPFNKYDSLASEDDLIVLYEVLNRFRDINGNPPIITANCVLANPDFDKIKKTDFQEYHYELFIETFKKYPKHLHSFELWKEGIDKKLFYPQFHGREHLNVARWMKALKLNLPETRLAFDLNFYGISTTINSEDRKSFLPAFAVDEISEENQIKKIITEGLLLFKRTFDYASKSFIAPNYIWASQIEQDLFKQDVKYIQGQRIQLSPVSESSKVKKIRHFTGQKNAFGQIYLVRNCWFEPSLDSKKDVVNECLAQIDSAFRWGKPAIITSHRVNFIGFIEQSNRDRNVLQLRELLSLIQKRWPDVEYMTTDKLGDLIISEKG
jgi:hypothetical protein